MLAGTCPTAEKSGSLTQALLLCRAAVSDMGVHMGFLGKILFNNSGKIWPFFDIQGCGPPRKLRVC